MNMQILVGREDISKMMAISWSWAKGTSHDIHLKIKL